MNKLNFPKSPPEWSPWSPLLWKSFRGKCSVAVVVFSSFQSSFKRIYKIGYEIYVNEWNWLKGQTNAHFPYEYKSQDIWLFIPFHCIIPYHFIPPRKKVGKKIDLEWCGMQHLGRIWLLGHASDTINVVEWFCPLKNHPHLLLLTDWDVYAE